MARPPRLVVPGLAHYIVLRGHNGACVFVDSVDREAFLLTLRETMEDAPWQLHAVAMLPTEAHLLLRPGTADALPRAMQNLGRRYVGAFNQRHGRTGTLWDGRYRSAVIEPGEMCLFALRRIALLALNDDAAASLDGGSATPLRPMLLTAAPEYWALGNTPFEREDAYRELLRQELSRPRVAALEAAVRSGRVLGTTDFVVNLARDLQRPLTPARRGRPTR